MVCTRIYDPSRIRVCTSTYLRAEYIHMWILCTVGGPRQARAGPGTGRPRLVHLHHARGPAGLRGQCLVMPGSAWCGLVRPGACTVRPRTVCQCQPVPACERRCAIGERLCDHAIMDVDRAPDSHCSSAVLPPSDEESHKGSGRLRHEALEQCYFPRSLPPRPRPATFCDNVIKSASRFSRQWPRAGDCRCPVGLRYVHVFHKHTYSTHAADGQGTHRHTSSGSLAGQKLAEIVALKRQLLQLKLRRERGLLPPFWQEIRGKGGSRGAQQG